MNRIFFPRITLALFLFFAGGSAWPGTHKDLRQIAVDVQVGREMAHALFAACEPHFRSVDLDPRFFVFFWDSARFDVFEGARLTLGTDLVLPDVRDLVSHSIPSTPPARERCERLVREDTPGNRSVPGVSEGGLQQMRDVYLSTAPDPHAVRDKSLFNDCVKARFNAGKRDFDRALKSCECTLTAMQSVPSVSLDEWLARSRAGENLPMSAQPWFPPLLPRLEACLAQ